MIGPSPTPTQSFETLDIQVKGLEGDVRDLKDSITGLDAKIDKSIASLAHEVRSAVTALTNQFTERQRTPWGVLISGAMAMIAVLGIVGSQALSPILSDVKSLKDGSVPRAELTNRSELNNRRLGEIETTLRILDQRRYDEMKAELDRQRSAAKRD